MLTPDGADAALRGVVAELGAFRIEFLDDAGRVLRAFGGSPGAPSGGRIDLMHELGAGSRAVGPGGVMAAARVVREDGRVFAAARVGLARERHDANKTVPQVLVNAATLELADGQPMLCPSFFLTIKGDP